MAIAEKRLDAAPAPAPRRRRRWLRGLAWLGAFLLVVLAACAVYILIQRERLDTRLSRTLPRLEGEVVLSGLAAPVRIERDGQGVPTIRAANRVDLARALGFLHAQDRFFQMDLGLRRLGAGEASELLGLPARGLDREARVFRFRALARRILGELPPDERALIGAYTEGVNAGLASLAEPPFEYLVLSAKPEPWRQEDTILAVLAMFQQLQGYTRRYEARLGLMRDVLPPELFRFLAPLGTEWDAPVAGGPLPAVPIPGPEVVDLRRRPPQAARLELPRHEQDIVDPTVYGGSSAWAVGGNHTASGGGMLANDVHLGLSVPNLWYRASFVWPAGDGTEHRVTGVTLPGIPLMVLGSNRHVAWGYTRSGSDASDVILLDLDPKDPDRYLTPEGPRKFEHHSEVISVSLWGDETLETRWTIWGPVIGEDQRGRLQVVRWVVFEPGAVNLSSYKLETATTADEAMDIANRSGAPAQNLLVADASGRVGWTMLGRLPRRVGFDGRLPSSWTDGKRRWSGLLPPEEVPRIVDPPAGRLWNANNRMAGGDMLARLGDGGYRMGARAGQIRDGLLSVERAAERDMLAIQLDDRALFLERWHRLLKSVLTPEAVAQDPRRRQLRDLIQRWEGHASVDAVSYRMVRSFHIFLAEQVGRSLTAPCLEVNPEFLWTEIPNNEAPLWQLVTQQPLHLLDPKHATWQDQFLAAVDQVLDFYDEFDDGVPLSGRTWGQANTTVIRHPLSQLMPLSREWLDMPARPLPGDEDMPRVQRPNFGATLRMVVTPGREEQGIFHMPAGQSGHPRSPYYRTSHRDWEEGTASPFLPGPPVKTLILRPREGAL